MMGGAERITKEISFYLKMAQGFYLETIPICSFYSQGDLQ